MAEDIKRLRYFNGLILREEEFNLEQDYHIRMRRLHNRYQHSAGIVFGLDVVVSSQQHKVKVTKGLALDRDQSDDNEEISHEIFLLEDTEVDLGQYAPNTSVYVWIEHAEEQTGIVPERGGDQPIYWREFGELKHGLTRPVAADKLLLARVDIKPDGAIDADSIQYTEGGDPLRLLTGQTFENLEVGSLKLFNTGIGANLPNLSGAVFDAPDNDTGIFVSAERVKFNGAVDIAGAAKLASTLNVTGAVNAQNTLTSGGKLTVAAGGAEITGSLDVNGDLEVSQNATIANDLNVGADLDVSGNAVIDGNLSVAGALQFNTIEVTSTAQFNNGLVVSGGNISASAGGISVSAGASIGTNASVGGNLTVTGNLGLSGQVSGSLNVASNVLAGGLLAGASLQVAGGAIVNEISTDTTFASPSNSALPTEFAVQAYVTQAINTAVNAALSAAGKIVGEIFYLDDWVQPSPTFPAVRLNDADQVISVANYPLLHPYLYAKPLRYTAGGGSVIDFPVTNFAIASNILTWTFSNTAAVNALLAALAEDQLVHGSYTNWLTVTNEATIAGVPADTRAITNINAGARTISVAYTAANASGTATGDLRFYLHRIAGSTTQARLFQIAGRGLIAAGDAAGEWIGGLRRRDRMQGHRHSHTWTNSTPINSVNGPLSRDGALNSGSTDLAIGSPTSDGVNGTPRTGATTDIRGLGVYAYIWARQFIP